MWSLKNLPWLKVSFQIEINQIICLHFLMIWCIHSWYNIIFKSILYIILRWCWHNFYQIQTRLFWPCNVVWFFGIWYQAWQFHQVKKVNSHWIENMLINLNQIIINELIEEYRFDAIIVVNISQHSCTINSFHLMSIDLLC